MHGTCRKGTVNVPVFDNASGIQFFRDIPRKTGAVSRIIHFQWIQRGSDSRRYLSISSGGSGKGAGPRRGRISVARKIVRAALAARGRRDAGERARLVTLSLRETVFTLSP